jgi:Zn-dependent protease with chaperone function
MRFVALGAVLSLAAFAVVASLAALCVAAAAPLLRRIERWAPARRAALLFAAGTLPTVAGLFAALALVWPAWIVHEPRNTSEAPGALLLAAAAAGLLLLASAVRRAGGDHLRTAHAVRRWMRSGQPIAALAPALPAFRVEEAFPLAAVAGLRRPRLLVARQVAEVLTEEELRAVAAHEAAHVRARDVAKRLALRASADPLWWTPARAALARAWERAAEEAADQRAAGAVPASDLASALVKVAALVPAGARLAVGLPAVAGGAPIATRVRALLASAPAAPVCDDARWPRRVFALATAVAGALLASAMLAPVHGLLEAVMIGFGAR